MSKQLDLYDQQFQGLKQQTRPKIVIIIQYIIEMDHSTNGQIIYDAQDQFMSDEESFSQKQDFDIRCDYQGFDDNKLVELHKRFGNKWKNISSHFPKKNDSFIKNHFYSLLRRALRKVNSYIRMKNRIYNQKNKLLKLNFVFKLTNLAQSQRNGMSNKNFYTNLLYTFLNIKNKQLQKINSKQQFNTKQPFQGIQNQSIQKLILSLRDIQIFFLQHNLNKKGKSKKKCPKKILLKKDAIQKSMHMMGTDYIDDKSIDDKSIDMQTNQQFSPLVMFCQNSYQINELRCYELEDQYVDDNNFIMPVDHFFDPCLFK